jgi:DNA-binding GntR family transcriptional regulator
MSRQVKIVRAEASLTSQVREAIRGLIVDGRLVPGTLHSVQALSNQFGVSRTPVREALIDLAQQGMVRFERNRGVRILQTSLHNLEEIFALRLLLEVAATYRAAHLMGPGKLQQLNRHAELMARAAEATDSRRRIEHDRAFHTVILEASGNHQLATFVSRLRDLIYARGLSSVVGRMRSAMDSVEEHRRVLRAIEAHDPELAAEEMKLHVLHTGRLVLMQASGAHTLDELDGGLLRDALATLSGACLPFSSRVERAHAPDGKLRQN